MPVAAVVAVALGALALTAAPSPGAEGASASLYALANSQRLEGRVRVSYECEAGEACEWSGEATAYAQETECPEEIEASHRVWSGALKRSTATAYGRFTFLPETPGGATLCMYLNLPLEDESELLEEVSEAVAANAPQSSGGSGHGEPPAGGGSQPQPAGQTAPSPAATDKTLARVYRPFRANGSTALRTKMAAEWTKRLGVRASTRELGSLNSRGHQQRRHRKIAHPETETGDFDERC